MTYTKPIIGKFGIRSRITKKMAFGICADTKRECKTALIYKIGYWESQRYRWQVSQWRKSDLELMECGKRK